MIPLHRQAILQSLRNCSGPFRSPIPIFQTTLSDSFYKAALLNSNVYILSSSFSTSTAIQARKKHKDPKWAELRRKKFLEEFNGSLIFPLADYKESKEQQKKMNQRMYLEKMKREGMLPPREFREREIDISSSAELREPYVPPEGDGIKSKFSKEGIQENKDRASQWVRTKKAIRKINKIEKDIGGFAVEYFCEEAVDIYVQAHEALMDDNLTRIHELVTDNGYYKMVHGLKYKTLRWKFLHNVEAPKVVHACLFEQGPSGNQFCQVTVRIHSQQSIAIYDRFGQLMYGSPEIYRNVLEFVVFEKRVSDTYGVWRMHGKIEPDWLQSKPPITKTFRLPAFEEIKLDDLERGAESKDLVGDDDDDDDKDKKDRKDTKEISAI